MSEVLDAVQDLKLVEPLFQNVKFYVSGKAQQKVLNLLQDGGGERMNYFSDFVTHCIIGDDASESDICDAKELYEVPAVTQKWVLYSVKCKKLLPTKGFLPDSDQLFTGIVACLSQTNKVDSKALWAMITFNGGQCQLNLNKQCTHLIVTKPEGAKYEEAVRHEGTLRIVTPDWVVDSVRSRGRCEEGLYHPRLLILPKPHSPTPPPAPSHSILSRSFGSIGDGSRSGSSDNSLLSTAQILGFADEVFDSKDLGGGEGGVSGQSGSKASLLEQLKQRMPWNQPQPATHQKQILTTMQHQQVLQQQKDQQLQQQLQQFQSIQQQQQQQRMAASSAGLTPATMQQQTLSSLQVSAKGGQLLQQQVLTSSPASSNVVMTGQGAMLQHQRAMQVVQQHRNMQVMQDGAQVQVMHQQRVIQQTSPHPQQQQIQVQQGPPWRQAIPQQQLPQQIQVQKQQFVLREGQPQVQPQLQQQASQQPQTQQYTVTVQREVVAGAPAGAGSQLTWQQQQQYHLQQQQQRQQLQQQQGQPQPTPPLQRQIAWTQQPQNQVPLRQLIHLDPQTHAQLQQMDPQQRTLFIQKIHKQRQIILQRQLQVQRQAQVQQQGLAQGIPRQQLIQQQQQPQPQPQVLIRGQLPAGLTSQQQLQWLQQHQQRQLQGQTVVINQQQQLLQQNPQLRQQQVLVQQQSPLRQQQLIAAGQNPIAQQQQPQQPPLVSGTAPGIMQNPQQLQTTAAAGTWIPQQPENAGSVQQTQVNQQQQLAQLQLQRQHQIQRLQQLQLQREAAAAAQKQQQQQVVVAGQRIQVQQTQPPQSQPVLQGQIQYSAQVPVQQQMVQGPMQSPLQQQQQQQQQQQPQPQPQQQQQPQPQPPPPPPPPPLQPQPTDEVAHQEHFQDLKTGVNQQAQQPSQQPQQPLVVNPKTKTALANMLSIRLQSGTAGTPHLSPQQPGAQGPVLVGQPSTSQEGSAAGQLRLMTAQHHAQQHQPPPGILQAQARPVAVSHIPPDQLLTYQQQQQQQRRTLGNITNATGSASGGGSPVRPPGMVVANSGAPHGGGVLQQQSPPVGVVVGAPGVGVAVAKSPYNQTAATAARVAAALAKSAQSVGQVQQQPRAQFYGHNPNLKLPPDLFLLGCIFLIVDYDCSMPDEVMMWQRIIVSSGGEVETVYGPRVTHVLCETQKSATIQRALREGKRCVTAYWLNDVVLKQQVLPPWQALHFPTSFSDDKPCKNHIIAFSGFEGEERARVRFMIEAIGAKCTSYFTKHNHILVCRRLEGAKYKKAREWNRPVVNAQWLNDILFGHYSCIQQPDMPKFQQFNLGNPFRIEYALIPHLMAAWKMPINITQESYDKIKTIPPAQRRVKRPRLDKSATSAGDSDQENMLENVEVTNLDPPSEDKRPMVLFSHVTNQPELAKKVKQLGGAVVDSHKEATHLVMAQAVRTVKLLCCLSTCKNLVSEAWVRDSHNHNKFLDEKSYILSDPEFEKEFGCHIAKVLEKPNRNELFKGKTFYMTPGVIPSPSVLADIIECAGGKVEKHRRSLKAIQEANQKEYSYLVITVGNDLHLLRDLIKCEIGVFNAEFVMSSVMRQEINYGAKSA